MKISLSSFSLSVNYLASAGLALIETNRRKMWAQKYTESAEFYYTALRQRDFKVLQKS